ncbi:helicase HerA-like domain-containing protein [Nonomuraea sediminis]|uniref:helicase HerA-like domain-containing protein n=1 Tax=Nonomuraea sediminis TaxID=2835864 RepID=UPI00202A0256|nr:helicase HerA-like domain-containing protein [Nonomuraea sediminis]
MLKDDVIKGYTFDGPTVDLGALVVDGEGVPEAQVRLPLRMLNRHGLVAGATGSGKTVTLQVMAEQLSAQGVPVFLADVKGDLSGVASAGESSDKLLKRTAGIGQDWQPLACPTEFYALGGIGEGIPLRATMSSFGPTLLSKVMGLNETQESSLGLIFHFADQQGLPLLDMKDLQSVIQYLIDNPDVLKGIGGLSKQTAGVILRSLTNLSAEGADQFFGEPEFDTADLMRVAPDGRGVVSVLELPAVQDRPTLFSTFLMWLLADLFHDLPEVGDADKPKLVFFFDEAHLLFTDASKEFLRSITQTVRLIRSKGVGVFFVTQTPKDVPADVLAQLGARVQHALRAFTPQDAKALRATVSTFPNSSYDLEEVLTQLGIGEAVVTVLGEEGIPTPVAWTRIRAPQTRMGPSDAAFVQSVIAGSPLRPKYAQPIDRQSAYEILAARLAPPASEVEPQAPPQREEPSVLESVLGSSVFKSFARSAASSLGREISRSIFGTARRRR